MSLVAGYSSDTDSDNDAIKGTTDVAAYTLPNTNPNETTKAVSGKYQHEVIDPMQFKKKKRSYVDAIVKGNGDAKATKSKAKEYATKKKQTKAPSTTDPFDINEYKGSWGSSDSSEEVNYTEKEEEEDDEKEILTDTQQENDIEFKESSKYYGRKMKGSIYDIPKDYQIRFATTIQGQKDYFVPKKLLSSYNAHKSAVTSLEFFPNYGQMLLSSGNDCMVKLWSTHKHTLIRDYHGHNRAVKHAGFSVDGYQFVSCSYDKTVKIWNTEEGEVEYKRNLNSNPNMSTFVPNKPDEFMVALHSGKVEHVDMRTNDLVQTYEHHQNAVTWIEFLNDGNKFITASDDRTLKIWDIRINMPIKYIQDPKQQAMPIVKRHPNGQYFVGQSMDNKILVYSAKQEEKFKKNNHKSFFGHNNAAYAIGMGFTPDGKTIFSGDSNGYCYFWDWKSTKVVRKIKVSDKVISCVDVHPLETSLFSMAGFDGKIYLYS